MRLLSSAILPVVASLVLLAMNCGVPSTSQGASTEISQTADSEQLKSIRAKVFSHVLASEFDAAIPLYEKAIRLARAEGKPELSIQFMNNLAGCYHLKYSYRDAVSHYRQALKDATRLGLKQQQTLATLNLAALFLVSGESDGARELISRLSLNRENFVASTRLDSYLQLVNIYTGLKDDNKAREAFELALKEADQEPPPALAKAYASQLAKWNESLRELRRAWAFATMSQALTKRNQTNEAIAYSLEAFRLRSIYGEKARQRDALQLAMLMRTNGDLNGASKLLKVARTLAPDKQTPMHLFLLDREEARIAIASGSFGDAIGPLRSALSRARGWRMEVLPTDGAFLNFESRFTSEVHEAFLDAISRNDFHLDQPGVAEESFWVAEEARFASMRAAQFPAAQFVERLPKAYWPLLAKFHRLQTNALPSTSQRDESATLRQQLNDLELEAGLNIPHAGGEAAPAFRDWQRGLPTDEVVHSYYLAEPYSLAWTVTRSSIRIRRIAGKGQLSKLVNQFRQEIVQDSQNRNISTGLELTRQLFGENLVLHRTTPYWTMVLDQDLSTLPIAALPTGGPKSQYLVQDHSLRVLPSAIFLSKFSQESWRRHATGVGDPIYNPVDSRYQLIRTAADRWMPLNRLPASALEISGSMTVLRSNGWTTSERTGWAATSESIRHQLEQSPDILHVSTHFVPQPGNPNQLNIALSPGQEQTATGLFTPLDLNSVRTRTKLVVLSGCSSSGGEVVPSIGINGLSRAFLIAGASTVIATLWPTIDSDGPIFPVFYKNLIQRDWSPHTAADSLRVAQLQMIREGGWTSKPSYWAAYLSISKG